MKAINTRNTQRVYLLTLFFLCINCSCTKLKTKVYDQVTNFWRTPDEIAAGVAPAYNGLRNFAPANDAFVLNEGSTDEIICPVRGGDWYDGGMWSEMWKHTWRPDHSLILGGWNFIYSNNGLPRVNSIIQAVNSVSPRPADYASIIAELKTVRAFYHFVALDLFGNVPIIDSNSMSIDDVKQKSRAEVFTYIEKEIKDNLLALTPEVNPKTYGRATQWFAHALLAKLYLNSVVYTGTPQWDKCIAACDAILNSNKYILEPDFFSNFKIANEGSKENIFVIPFDINNNLNSFWLQGATLHYQSNETFGLEGGGYNGFCSTAEYYNLFNPNDVRRKMFLVGQQYKNQVVNSSNMQYDAPTGLPLSFNPVITSFINSDPSSRMLGARCAKWEFNKEGQGIMSNDFAIFRLADIILTKAEAQFRKGETANALATINQYINGVSIRSRTGLPDFSISEMTLDGLLKERACELSWEGWRRNDMIRFGHFSDARIPDKNSSDSIRRLYPIPSSALALNPSLQQNPGY